MLNIPSTISAVPAIRGLAGSLIGLCTLSVAGRFWARSLQKTGFRSDDWLMIPAWLFFIGLCACLLESTYIHTLGYTPAQAAPFHPSALDGAKIQITIDILLALCLGLVKISALLFYKRVFCPADMKSTFKTVLNCFIVAISCWTVAFIIFPLSMCGSHFDGYWNRPVFNKYCRTAHPYLLSGSVTDFFFELVVVVLPIPKIWNLQTTTRRRLAVMFIFLTALLSLGASIARLAIVAYLAVQTVTDAAVAAFANSAVFFMWTLEAGAAIIAINMPSLWYFRNRKAPEKILHSLRSIMSLRSTKSREWSDSLPAGYNKDAELASPVVCPAPLVRVHIGADAWSGSRSSSDAETMTAMGDNIKVTKQLSQSVEKI